MKRFSIYCILSIALSILASCNQSPTINLKECKSFAIAKPVWAKGRETERNLTLAFREVIETENIKEAYIRLTASCDYRLRVNGDFVSHGPCVAAHDFYRIDCIDLKPYLESGKNVIAIEVAGYNDDNYYLLNQPSFLQAEVEINGKVLAATGSEFQAYDMKQRKQDVPEFSFQRPHTEYYILSANFDEWLTNPEWQGTEGVQLVEQPTKALLPRHVEYPDYKLHEAKAQPNNIHAFECNSSGFLGIKVNVEEPTLLQVHFDEVLNKDGNVDSKRLICNAYIIYELQPGNYTIESFEPYTMKYVQTIVEKGKCNIEGVYMRDYCNSDVNRATFLSSNKDLNRLFEAARETFRQNALDVFMDCPSRERAGWLCDSYFSSRVAFDLSGDTQIEHNFIQNFLLPDKFKHIDEGMLPMCYPSDHPNKNHIPNWAMWFVLQLEEYLHRSGDREMIDDAKIKVYALIDYFKQFINEDGLLEKLTRWVFVEWSHANNLVQNVNYPSNMLYAQMLDVAGRLYNDSTLNKQGEQIKETVDFYLPMVELTGTLWENMTIVASCNHGFASHIAHVLYRDVLGVYNISPTKKTVTLRIIDSGLEHCQGSIPVNEESVDIEWTKEKDKFNVTLSLPEGYNYKVITTEKEVNVSLK